MSAHHGRLASVCAFCFNAVNRRQPHYTSARPCSRGAGAISDLQRLTVSLRGGCEQQPQCLLFSFTGQLDAYSDKQFIDFVGGQLGAPSQPVVLDLSRIDFLDSSGLGALVQLAKQFQQSGHNFLVVGNARVVQTVKLVRLEDFLHLQPDLDTALGRLSAA